MTVNQIPLPFTFLKICTDLQEKGPQSFIFGIKNRRANMKCLQGNLFILGQTCPL